MQCIRDDSERVCYFSPDYLDGYKYYDENDGKDEDFIVISIVFRWRWAV